MIKEMRLKIIGVSMIALIALLGAVLITINIFMGQVALRDVDNFIHNVIENDGQVVGRIVGLPQGALETGRDGEGLTGGRPETEATSRPEGETGDRPENEIGDRPESPGQESSDMAGGEEPPQPTQISGVSLEVGKDGVIDQVFFNDEELTDSEISIVIFEILESEEANGDIEHYRYGVQEREDTYLIVFANASVQNDLMSDLYRVSFIVGVSSLAVLFILLTVLAKYITKPVEETMEKQKRFISDSSHELKTPLSIISANVDLLEMEIGENARTIAIGEGISRMKNLINDLIMLARTEQHNYTFTDFNYSEVVESTILPMEVVAYEQGKTIDISVEEDLMYHGNEEGIKKMIGALLENAIKYSYENTVIAVNLASKGNYIVFEVFNEGIGVTKEQKDKLFDKFYRVDDSRHRETGGHGIGLSIVSNIVEAHRGRIVVDSEPDKFIVFKVILPM